VEKILVLLSLLGLLLVLAPPALGNTRSGGASQSYLRERNQSSDHSSDATGCGVPVPPNNTVPIKQGTSVVVLRFQTYGDGTTQAVAELPDGYVVWLPHNAVNYETQRTTRAVDAPVLCNHLKPQLVASLPNSGGITPGVIALAGMALLTGGSLLVRRIVSW
jgi:LPXTG-motif cell wall-anchored protein